MIISVDKPEKMEECSHAFDISPGVQSSFLVKSCITARRGYARMVLEVMLKDSKMA